MEKSVKNKLLPLILLILVVIIDQISKSLVVKYIAPYDFVNCPTFLGGFLRFVFVYNPGVAFSVGASWGENVRRILFSLIPIIVLILVMVVYFRNKDFSKLQRWAICGIVGGGLGNIIDRIFRPSGVVDFIDVQWFGIEDSSIKFLRWDRWPTFNIADSAVVVCGILLIISFIVTFVKDAKNKKTAKKGEE